MRFYAFTHSWYKISNEYRNVLFELARGRYLFSEIFLFYLLHIIRENAEIISLQCYEWEVYEGFEKLTHEMVWIFSELREISADWNISFLPSPSAENILELFRWIHMYRKIVECYY